MPRVPSYGGFHSTQNTLSYTPFSLNTPKAPDSGIGDALGKAASAIDKLVEKQDDARVTAALTELRRHAIDVASGENGYEKLKGENALQPDDEGRGLVERVDKDMHDFGTSLAEKLTPRQQKLFNERAQPIYTSSYGGVSQYLSNEGMRYQLQVPQDAVDQLVESGVSYAGNPDMLDRSAREIDAQIDRLADLAGLSSDRRAALKLKNRSSMYVNAIEQVLSGAETNPHVARQALGLLEANRGSMTGSDAVRLRTKINAYLKTAEMYDLVDGADIAAGSMVLAGNDPAVLIATDSLSPEKRKSEVAEWFINGVIRAGGSMQENPEISENPSESKYGYSKLSVGQAMEAAKRAGIPWDQEAFLKDGSYNVQVGFAYVDQLEAKYAGDHQKVFAAYRLGEDAVDKAVREADEGEGESWFDRIPQEGRDYVARLQQSMDEAIRLSPKDANGNVMSSFRPGQARAEANMRAMTPDEARAYVTGKSARARTDPVFREQAIAAVMGRVAQRKASYTQERERLRAELVDEIYQVGGDVSKIPASVWGRYTWKEQQDAFAYARKLASGDNSTNVALFGQLMNNPSILMAMSEDQLRGTRAELSKSDYAQLVAKYYKLKSVGAQQADARTVELRGLQLGKASASLAGEVQWGDVSRALSQIVPGWADMEQEEKDRITWVASEAVGQAYTEAGGAAKGPLNVAELLKPLSRDLVTVTGTIWDSEKSLFKLTMSDLPNRGPSDALPVVKELTKLKVGHDPSDNEINNELLRLMVLRHYPVPRAVVSKLDAALVDRIQAEMKAHGRAPLIGADLVRAYVLERIGRGTGTVKEDPMTKLPFDAISLTTGDY